MAFLEKRKGRWYAVHCVPARLRPIIGKSNFVRSLATHDRQKAERLLGPIAAAWRCDLAQAKKLVDELRSGSPLPEASSPPVLKWLDEYFSTLENAGRTLYQRKKDIERFAFRVRSID